MAKKNNKISTKEPEEPKEVLDELVDLDAQLKTLLKAENHQWLE